MKKELNTNTIFIVIYIINFYIPRLMPGDPFPIQKASGNEMEGLSPEEIQRMKAYYGLDDLLTNNL